MYVLPAGLASSLRLLHEVAAPMRAARRATEPARRMQRTYGPVLRMAAQATRAAREHKRQQAARPRGCDRRSRPRARRTAATSSTSSADPGDGEPPRSRRRSATPALLRTAQLAEVVA